MITRYIVLTLTVYYQDGLDRWCISLSYVRGVGEVVASGVDRDAEDRHWDAEPLAVAA